MSLLTVQAWITSSPFPETPRWAEQVGGRRPPQEDGVQDAGQGVLTEEEDVLQILEEGALEFLLLLPGQLLGDHAAVTQPSPQPVGRGGMARGRSEREGLGYPTPRPTPRTCPAFPHCVAHPVGSAHHMLLSLGRNLEKCSLLKALRSPAVAELTPEHPRLILHRTLWSSLCSCPHHEWGVR